MARQCGERSGDPQLMEPNMKPVFRAPPLPPSKRGLLSLEIVLEYGDKDPEKDEEGGDV